MYPAAGKRDSKSRIARAGDSAVPPRGWDVGDAVPYGVQQSYGYVGDAVPYRAE